MIELEMMNESMVCPVVRARAVLLIKVFAVEDLDQYPIEEVELAAIDPMDTSVEQKVFDDS